VGYSPPTVRRIAALRDQRRGRGRGRIFILARPLFAMKLRECHSHLQYPAVVKALAVRSVHASMALADRPVPVARLETLSQTAPPPPTGPAGP
jgi:hypothetical protein